MHKTGLKAIMIEGFYISKQVIEKEGKLPNNFAWTCVTGQQISFILQHISYYVNRELTLTYTNFIKFCSSWKVYQKHNKCSSPISTELDIILPYALMSVFYLAAGNLAVVIHTANSC